MEDLVGKRFGHLVVVSHSHMGKRWHHYWHCVCACGTYCTKSGDDMRSARADSCGCLHRARLRASCHNRSHNASDTPIYRVWQAMLNRCRNRNMAAYIRYGGRGISVCARWRDSFEAFLSDMGPPPEGGSVERLNNDGNYEPANCRWASRKEQGRNKRNNHILAFRGETLCLAAWAERLGLDQETIRKRLKVMSVEEALAKPGRRK
jgi:hypothetical protein